MATIRPYGPPTGTSAPGDGTLMGLVRGWANRDSQALPDAIIMDAIRYSVDMAYRTLRIPPLEHTVLWTDADGLDAASIGEGNIYQSVTALAVPPDLIEFIHIRGTDANGLTTRVFNEKSDIRSFWDICSNHYDQSAFWSRQGDQVLITPSFGNAARGFYGGGSGPETRIEMYYYRRLPALNATFNVVASNANAADFNLAVTPITNGFLTQRTSGFTGAVPLYFALVMGSVDVSFAAGQLFQIEQPVLDATTGLPHPMIETLSDGIPGLVMARPDGTVIPTSDYDINVLDTNGTVQLVYTGGGDTVVTYATARPTTPSTMAYDSEDAVTDRFLTTLYFTGNSVPNWFKDENEKIVLYGALAQCFAYLQEDDQSGKYLQLMQKEIDDLNNEDRIRDSSGGNVQVQYSARGLI